MAGRSVDESEVVGFCIKKCTERIFLNGVFGRRA